MNSLDNIFKRSLASAETPAPSGLWSKIDKSLSSSETTAHLKKEALNQSKSLFSSLISTSILVVSIGVCSLLVSKNNIPVAQNNLPKTLPEKTSPIRERISQKTKTTKTQPKARNSKPSLHEIKLKSTPVTVITKINKNVPDLPLVAQPETEFNTQTNTAIKPSTLPDKIEEALNQEKKEEIHKKGEFVTFTIKYNNTSGKRVKNLKVWEEFPDWCDARTLETLGHNTTHQVKTIIKESQNTVEWKIKGDFSPDLLNPSNTGFIEYRVKINEDRKTSDLEKNKPGVK